MDKNCVEIFAEVLGLSVHYVKRDADDYSEGCFAKALKAMKIAMRQAYIAGYNGGFLCNGITPDEYLTKLEDQK